MTYSVKVYYGVRVPIPAKLRKKLCISEGDRLTFTEQDGRIILTTSQHALQRA